MSTSTKSPDFLNLPEKQSFPFEYGKVLLFDELKLRAYKQQIELYQSKIMLLKPNTAAFQALEASEKIQTSIEAENKKRCVLYPGIYTQIFWFERSAKILWFWGWLISLFYLIKFKTKLIMASPCPKTPPCYFGLNDTAYAADAFQNVCFCQSIQLRNLGWK